jgi:hypothetical protein
MPFNIYIYIFFIIKLDGELTNIIALDMFAHLIDYQVPAIYTVNYIIYNLLNHLFPKRSWFSDASFNI